MKSWPQTFMWMPTKNGGKILQTKNLGSVSIFFADKYHNLKLTQKLNVVQTGYHRSNDVFIKGDMTRSSPRCPL